MTALVWSIFGTGDDVVPSVDGGRGWSVSSESEDESESEGESEGENEKVRKGGTNSKMLHSLGWA